MRRRKRGRKRDRAVHLSAADVAQEPVREASLSAHGDRGVDHPIRVDPEPGPGADGEAMVAVGDPHRLRQSLSELGLQQLSGRGPAEAADVDPGDPDALGDRVRAALIPEIGIGAAGGEGGTAHGSKQATREEQATAHLSPLCTPLVRQSAIPRESV